MIAIYGATGHTGRLVAAELAARGHELVLAGRNAEALHAMSDRIDGSSTVRVAGFDVPHALRAVTEQAPVVINCAGPFTRSGAPVASAALATGSHYLDHAAEPLYVKSLFDDYQDRAHQANAVVIPGMSFYGAVPDLLAALVADGVPEVDSITVAYAVSGWRMTATSKETAMLLRGQDRVVFADGTSALAPAAVSTESFEFPAPVGTQPVLVDYPAGEVVTIPRHARTRAVRVLFTAGTFAEEDVFTSEHLDPTARARSAFTVVVQAKTDNGTRTAVVRGQDIYRVGATMSAEAAERLAQAPTPVTGVRGAAEVFPPKDFLGALERRDLITLS